MDKSKRRDPVIFDQSYDIDNETGCWNWNRSTNAAGRGKLYIGGKLTVAPRHGWERLRGPIPEGMWVLHKCDNPRCVNLDHMFLGTSQDNIDDMVRKKRQRAPRGEKQNMAKLHAGDIPRIRDMFVMGERNQEIGKYFGVTTACIYAIRHGRSWRHVPHV